MSRRSRSISCDMLRISCIHRVQGLQRGGPLYSACGLRPSGRAWGGRAGPGCSGYAELLHATGAAPFHQSTNAVKTNGGKEAPQGELWSSIKLSVNRISEGYFSWTGF